MKTQEGIQVQLPPRPTINDREAWKDYWKAQGQPWRAEPEIDTSRQEELAKRREIVSDIEQGIYPFRGMKLNRADIEWLLATHDGGRGPLDWSDEREAKAFEESAFVVSFFDRGLRLSTRDQFFMVYSYHCELCAGLPCIWKSPALPTRRLRLQYHIISWARLLSRPGVQDLSNRSDSDACCTRGNDRFACRDQLHCHLHPAIFREVISLETSLVHQHLVETLTMEKEIHTCSRGGYVLLHFFIAGKTGVCVE